MDPLMDGQVDCNIPKSTESKHPDTHAECVKSLMQKGLRVKFFHLVIHSLRAQGDMK